MASSLRIVPFLLSCMSITLTAGDRDKKQQVHNKESEHAAFNVFQEKTIYCPLPNDDGGVITFGSLVFLKHRNNPLRLFGRVRECDSIKTVTISDDGDTLAVGTKGGLRYVWNQHGTLMLSDTSPASLHPVHSMALSRDGYKLATVFTDGLVRIFDFKKYVEAHIFKSFIHEPHHCIFVNKSTTLKIANNIDTEVWDLTVSRLAKREGLGKKAVVLTDREQKQHKKLLTELLSITMVVDKDVSLRHDTGLGKAPHHNARD